jgi:septum site-determining protein MinC
MASSEVKIKGTREGLLITLGEGELSNLLAELKRRLEGAASFFKGGKATLEVGNRELSVEDVEGIRDVLAESGISLEAVLSDAMSTKFAAQVLGLEPRLTKRREVRKELLAGAEISQGLLVHCTLRSGQVIRHHGHVVIIGDVNPGAEVIAGGDIIIWGKLRGTAHAGAMGDDSRIVCALSLSPTQLRIGNYIARSPEGVEPTNPEVASVQEGHIVVEPWGVKD